MAFDLAHRDQHQRFISDEAELAAALALLATAEESLNTFHPDFVATHGASSSATAYNTLDNLDSIPVGGDATSILNGPGLLAFHHAPGKAQSATLYTTRKNEPKEEGEIEDSTPSSTPSPYRRPAHSAPPNAPREPRALKRSPPRNRYRGIQKPRSPPRFAMRNSAYTYVDLDAPEGPRELRGRMGSEVLAARRASYGRGRGSGSYGSRFGPGRRDGRSNAQVMRELRLPEFSRVQEWSYEKETAKLWAMDMK